MRGNNIAMVRKARGLSQTELADQIGTTLNMMGKLERGDRELNSSWLSKLATALRVTPSDLVSSDLPALAGAPEAANDDDMVEVQHIDLAFGLGASYTDDQIVEIDQIRFHRGWLETISSSPPALLTWTRGRGDSMMPTISDGDLILLDRSQRQVKEQDAMWAFTVGEVASIKRLRVKGDRFLIFSDNPSVSPDEEPIDFVNVVARVVFVGRRT